MVSPERISSKLQLQARLVELVRAFLRKVEVAAAQGDRACLEKLRQLQSDSEEHHSREFKLAEVPLHHTPAYVEEFACDPIIEEDDEPAMVIGPDDLQEWRVLKDPMHLAQAAGPAPAPGDSVREYQLSASARREVLRIQLKKRLLIAKSLAMASAPQDRVIEPDNLLAEDWNCSGTYALLPKDDLKLVAEDKESLDASLGPAEGGEQPVKRFRSLRCSDEVTDTTPPPSKTVPIMSAAAESVSATPPAPPQPQKPLFNSPKNPYRHYSQTALTLLAQNPSTQSVALCWLCLHNNSDIRGAVARNTNCPPEALARLAKDHEAGIRHAVAENPRSPLSVLELLLNDKNPLIAWRAQNHANDIQGRTVQELKLPDWSKYTPPPSPKQAPLPISSDLSATEETVAFLKLIARRTNTPARRLAELARHPDPRVRSAVAENANTPLELLWLLAKDPNQDVKLKVTENYNCPVDILEGMKEDPDEFVAWQARSVLTRIVSGPQAQQIVDGKGRARTSSRDLI